MEKQLRNYHVYRIIADTLPFTYNDKNYYITSPTEEFRFYGEKVYIDIYNEAMEKTIAENDVIILLNKYGMWGPKEEESYGKIPEEIENTKVVLYENFAKKDMIPVYKKVLKDLREEYERISYIRRSMNYLTAEYLAMSAKQRFLIGASILDNNKRRIWKRFSDWDKDNKIIDTAFNIVIENHINDNDIRDLVKNDPWKTIWSMSKRPTSIFHKNVGGFSDEQKNLAVWSFIYDNIYKSTEAPNHDIVEDDDALDGWMIKQRKKNESDIAKIDIGRKIDNRAAKCQEIFILTNDEKEIKNIFDMNDFEGKLAFKRRMRQIKEHGEVNEINMHDTREKLRMYATQLTSQGHRG